MCHVVVHASPESFASDEIQCNVGYKYLWALSCHQATVSVEKAGRSSCKKVGISMVVSRAIGTMLWSHRESSSASVNQSGESCHHKSRPWSATCKYLVTGCFRTWNRDLVAGCRPNTSRSLRDEDRSRPCHSYCRHPESRS
jgi:hypothetical protein